MLGIQEVDFRQTVILRWVAIAMLLGAAVSTWPFGYYTILRWVVSACAAWMLVLIWPFPTKWKLVFGVITILFNPLAPVHLSRSPWIALDLVAAVLLAVSTHSISNNLHKPSQANDIPSEHVAESRPPRVERSGH